MINKQLIVFLITLLISTSGSANPAGGVVSSGDAVITQSANQTTIQQNSQKAIINWQSFNIGAGEKTHFQQPQGGIALNRINATQGPSQIYGQLTATGKIILVNQSGIFFGPGSYVNVGAIIASTSGISDQNFLAGKLIFDQPSVFNASIINKGTIIAAENGLVAMLGTGVSNDGLIQAQTGNVILASGNKFTVDLYGDQLINFAVDQGTNELGVDQDGNTMKTAVKNAGTIVANGGTVLMTAKSASNLLDNAINMSGVVQANSIDQKSGTIILSSDSSSPVIVSGLLDVSGVAAGQIGGTVKVLGKKVGLMQSAKINAYGDSGGGEVLIGGNARGQGPEMNADYIYMSPDAVINASALTNGNGGKVILWGNESNRFYGTILSTGGAISGDGGWVETSAKYLDAQGYVNAGSWLLDPLDLIISDNVDNNVTGSSPFEPTGSSSNLKISTLLAASGNVIVETTNDGFAGNGDITIQNSFDWNHSTTLTLSAYRDINIASGVVVSSSTSNAGLVLRADNTGTGSGTINFQGSGTQVNYTGTGQSVTLYYNPASYSAPTIFTGIDVTLGTYTPYMLINDLNGLNAVSADSALWGYNFALGRNIDATSTSALNGGTGFSPIGNDTTSFSGWFDGQGYDIDGLYINSATSGNKALFGNTSSAAVIQNIGLTNVSITSSNTSSLTGVAGLVGNNAGAIINSFVTGSITSASGFAGGLVSTSSGAISNSYSTADVSAITAGGTISVGGLVGENRNGGTITNSYSSGNVVGNSLVGTTLYYFLGGLVGQSNNSGGTISNSYSTGTVTQLGSNGILLNAIGGFIGFFNGAQISNSYSSGAVTALGGVTPGGFVGIVNGASSLSNVFWDTTTSTVAQGCGSGTCTSVNGKTTAELLDASTYTGWSITSAENASATIPGTTWFMIDGNTRPILLSEWSANIKNAHQLQLMSAALDADYTLANNIDASIITNSSDVWGTSTINNGVGFFPVGLSSAFTGNVDGNQYAVDQLYMDRTYLLSTSYNSAGLFGNVSGSSIRNLGLTNISINVAGDDSANTYAGALAGRISSSSISGVYSSGLVAESVVNSNLGSGVGGLIGFLDGSTLDKSYSSAAVTGGNGFLGGLVGYTSGVVTIENTYATGSATLTTASGIVGGAVGYLDTTDGIYNSFSAGAVNCALGGTCGGFIGLLASGSAGNTNFWDTITSGKSTSAGSAVGYNTAQARSTNATYTGWQTSAPGVWSIVEGVSYPYLTDFFATAPMVVTGTVSNNTNPLVGLAINGQYVSASLSAANSGLYSYYFLLDSALAADSNPFVIYVAGDSSQGNAISQIASGNTSINLSTLVSGSISMGGTITNPYDMIGSLNPTDFLFSVSNSNEFIASAPVILTSNTTLNGSSVNGSFTFNDTVNGAYDLSINTGTGITEFNGIVGGVTPLDQLTVSGLLNLNTTGITTSGSQTYENAITLGSDTTLTGAGIDFQSTIDSDSVSRSLVVNNASGSVNIGDKIGSVKSLSELTITSDSLFMNAGSGYLISTTGDQNYNAYSSSISISSPASAAIALQSTSNGDIYFNDEVSIGNLADLTIDTGGTTTFNGLVSVLGDLTVNSGVDLGSDTELTSQNLTIAGNLFLGLNRLTLNQSGTGSLSGIVSGQGGLTFAGSGTTTLSTANTYSGITNINSGTVMADQLAITGSNSSLGFDSTINITNGTLVSTSSESVSRTFNFLGTTGVLSANTGVILDLANSVLSGDVLLAGLGTMTLSSITSGLTSLISNVAGLNLTGDITSQDSQTYNSHVVLNNDAVLTSSSGAGVTFNLSGALNSQNGTQGVSFGDNSGAIVLNGPVGNITQLSSISIGEGNSTTISSGGVSTSGTQTYLSGIQLSGNTVLSSDLGDLVFSSVTGNNHSLSLIGGAGSNQFVFTGTSSGLSSFTIDGGSSGADRINFANLSQDVALTLSGSGGNGFSGSSNYGGMTFSNINDLSVNSLSNSSLTGASGSATWEFFPGNSGSYTGGNSLAFSNFKILNAGDSGDNFLIYSSLSGTINGGSGNDVFTLNQDGFVSGGIHGGSGNNTLNAADSSNFLISGNLSGDVSSTFTNAFTNMQNLVATAGDAEFAFTSGGSVESVTGVIGALNTLNYNNYGSAASVDLASSTASGVTTNFNNINKVIGDSTYNGTVTAADIINSWMISSVNAGTIGALINGFSQISNLVGGADVDTFTFASGAKVTGSVNGGSSNNVNQFVFADPVQITLSSISSGQVTGAFSFSQMQQATSSGSSGTITIPSGGSKTYTVTYYDASKLNGEIGDPFYFYGFNILNSSSTVTPTTIPTNLVNVITGATTDTDPLPGITVLDDPILNQILDDINAYEIEIDNIYTFGCFAM